MTQAHLFEAKQLEAACLNFIKSHLDQVVVEESFINLAQDWPAVALKIHLHTAGVSENLAKDTVEQAESRKRKRDNDGAASADA